MDADGLHRPPVAELPVEVVAFDELAQAGMEGLDMVVLEINLDEALPVIGALMDLDVVEHIARKVELAPHAGALKVGCHIPLA